MASVGQRLVDFVSAFVEPLTSPPAADRHAPVSDRHQLARQLLGTLSRDVLAETGHVKPRPRQRRRARGPDPRVAPQPRPVGDLARP